MRDEGPYPLESYGSDRTEEYYEPEVTYFHLTHDVEDVGMKTGIDAAGYIFQERDYYCRDCRERFQEVDYCVSS